MRLVIKLEEDHYDFNVYSGDDELPGGGGRVESVEMMVATLDFLEFDLTDAQLEEIETMEDGEELTLTDTPPSTH